MGYTLYLPARTNLRYFPAIPRDSKRFKDLFKERSGVERSNATDDSYQVDHRCRNAAYALVRLTLVNCAKHAKLRWLELKRRHTEAELFQQAWERILTRA